jgi:hypothetical protein
MPVGAVTLTPFGWFFAALALGVLLAARRWLPALLAFAAVPQAGAVLHVKLGATLYGVPAYQAVALVAVPVFLWRWIAGDRLRFGSSAQQRAFRLVVAYLVLAMVGSALLPTLFAGVPVFELTNPLGFEAEPVPLRWGLSQLAQAINATVHGFVLCYLLQAAGDEPAPGRRVLLGLAAGTALACVLGLHERLALAGVFESWSGFWMNNPTYNQGHGASVAGMARISVPFSEPSYGSAFLAAAFAGALFVAGFGRRAGLALAAAVGLGAFLLNTLGSTGLFAAALLAPAVLLLASLGLRPAAATAQAVWSPRQLRTAWYAFGLALAAVLWVGVLAPHATRFGAVLEGAILDKLGGGLETLSTLARSRSNEHALAVVRDTWGLGAGLGGNRASSYLAAMASNLGWPGLALFAALLLTLARAYWRAPTLPDAGLLAWGAFVGGCVAVAIGIPDLNLPWFWMLLFAAVLHCPRSERS